MTLYVCIGIILFVAYKAQAIVKRNNLNAKQQRNVLISAVLVTLFLITSITLPYPESLYWFLFIGTISTTLILSNNVVKKECNRFKNLPRKDLVLNVLFYCSLIILFNLNY